MAQGPDLQASPGPCQPSFLLLQTSSQGALSDHGSSGHLHSPDPTQLGQRQHQLRQKSLTSWGPGIP